MTNKAGFSGKQGKHIVSVTNVNKYEMIKASLILVKLIKYLLIPKLVILQHQQLTILIQMRSFSELKAK